MPPPAPSWELVSQHRQVSAGNPSSHKNMSQALKSIRFLILHINRFLFDIWIWIYFISAVKLLRKHTFKLIVVNRRWKTGPPFGIKVGQTRKWSVRPSKSHSSGSRSVRGAQSLPAARQLQPRLTTCLRLQCACAFCQRTFLPVSTLR